MFYYISGTLAHRETGCAVLDCGGVGYRLTISQNTLAALDPLLGKPAKLFTHLAVREDDIELFGFFTEDELHTFRLLIGVSGIGPKAAMACSPLLRPAALRARSAAKISKRFRAPTGSAQKARRESFWNSRTSCPLQPRPPPRPKMPNPRRPLADRYKKRRRRSPRWATDAAKSARHCQKSTLPEWSQAKSSGRRLHNL